MDPKSALSEARNMSDSMSCHNKAPSIMNSAPRLALDSEASRVLTSDL
jgi:hypothetical protein